MYKLDIQVDAKESAAVERRRIMEQQRKGRIFNTRERVIGVSHSLVAIQLVGHTGAMSGVCRLTLNLWIRK